MSIPQQFALYVSGAMLGMSVITLVRGFFEKHRINKLVKKIQQNSESGKNFILKKDTQKFKDEASCLAQHSAAVQLILRHGAENLIFMMPMRPLTTFFNTIAFTSSSDALRLVPCVIADPENSSWGFRNDYKIRLVPLYAGFGAESMYIDSFNTLLLDEKIVVYVNAQAREEIRSISLSNHYGAAVARISMPSLEDIKQCLDNAKHGQEVHAVMKLLYSCCVEADPIRDEISKLVHAAYKHGCDNKPWEGSWAQREFESLLDNLVPEGIRANPCRLSYSEALDRLSVINNELCKLNDLPDEKSDIVLNDKKYSPTELFDIVVDKARGLSALTSTYHE